MLLNIDISQVPAPLPTPRLTKVSTGISLLPPLSRKGYGPGLVILTPNSEDNLEIRSGVPSILRKWAEEGYTLVEIQENALSDRNAEEILKKAVLVLSRCDKCELKGSVGLVGEFQRIA
jgi:carboxymethylenebutenolidase